METIELVRLPVQGGSETQIVLRHRAPPGPSTLPPVLLVHGATFGSALFDLPRLGYSLMAALAERRFVYALDARGYGLSLGGGVMDAPPEQHPPFATADEVCRDIAAAVAFILNRHGVAALDLVGFSWGTITASRFASANADKVARLALYAPLYKEVRPLWRGSVPSEAYRRIRLSDVISRWDADLPSADAAVYREPDIAKLLFETVAALDPQSGSCAPAAFRCPNGALADLAQVAQGRPLFEPKLLTMPVLLIRGEDDVTATDADARRLLALLPSRDKRYCVVKKGSHFLCVERGRGVLYGELNAFLGRQETRSVA